MRDIVIADTSSLIAFDKLDLFFLLSSQYEKVLVTPTVRDEFGKRLPGWIDVAEPRNAEETAKLKRVLDPGEATAIALAEETEDCEIILDDQKARKVAERIGLQVLGTVAVIERGYDDGLIPKTRDAAAELKSIGFRISDHLEDILKQAMRDAD